MNNRKLREIIRQFTVLRGKATMAAQLICGDRIAQTMLAHLSTLVTHRLEQQRRAPGLAVIQVGDHPASRLYIEKKQAACQRVGVRSFSHFLPKSTTQAHLIELIHTLNQDETVDGILIQLPLMSSHDINTAEVIHALAVTKDVDGLHPHNLGALAQRTPKLRACTPKGIIHLLDSIDNPYRHQHAVIVGASNLVGRPMALELLLKGATVTVTHRFTDPLEQYVKIADLLVVSVGKPQFIPGNWIKPGATVIDVGITRTPEGKVVGDIEFQTARARAQYITPVPGGVGPLTVASLVENTIEACNRFHDPL